jgi:hypothetical protein
LGLNANATRKTANTAISITNMRRRPQVSASPPSVTAPTMIPASAAALTSPLPAGDRPKSATISGRATPVMNTTSPSKNLPAVASPQMRHCMRVMGTETVGVPSGQNGVWSI